MVTEICMKYPGVGLETRGLIFIMSNTGLCIYYISPALVVGSSPASTTVPALAAPCGSYVLGRLVVRVISSLLVPYYY